MRTWSVNVGLCAIVSILKVGVSVSVSVGVSMGVRVGEGIGVSI